jgi:hypothetical protein
MRVGLSQIAYARSLFPEHCFIEKSYIDMKVSICFRFVCLFVCLSFFFLFQVTTSELRLVIVTTCCGPLLSVPLPSPQIF